MPQGRTPERDPVEQKQKGGKLRTDMCPSSRTTST